ncbi:DEAD/DEAH box helicase family protein [Hydrogenophaga sp.]|uniref:DEAD/DEAH box helicase family protein n=1 Tax=Hydrogenophaga sp. TaxID=1904254 RepID=UPI003F6D950F
MKRTQITVDARGAGQGKTRKGIYPMLTHLAKTNTPTLIVVPSQLLQEQYCTDNPTLKIRKINSSHDSGSGLNVSAEILNALSHREQMVIITEEAFRRTHISWDIKCDYHLIIDEAINPYSIEELRIDPKIALQLDKIFSVEDEGKAWGQYDSYYKIEIEKMDISAEEKQRMHMELSPKSWACLKRTAVESSSIFEESLQWRRLMNPNTRLWVTWAHWQKIKAGDTRELSIAVELSDSMMNGWISVHVAAAAFDSTFMSMWLKANGVSYLTSVPFAPHKQAPIFHMPQDEFSWSKYRRNAQPDALPEFYRYVESQLQGGPCLVVRNNDELNAKLSNEQKITHNVHGINTYSESTAVCLSTALKPGWSFKSFLTQQAEMAGIGDQDRDGFIAKAFGSYMFYQILMRSALRVESNSKPVHCFVLDYEIAMGLMDYFDAAAQIKQISPFALTCMNKSPRKKSKIAMTPAEKQKRYRERKAKQAQVISNIKRC